MTNFPGTAARSHQQQGATTSKVIRSILLFVAGALIVIKGLAMIFGGGGYGTKLEFKKCDLYYTKAVTADEAKRLGEYCVREELFGDNKISTQIDKSDGTYQFRMVVKSGSENDEQLIRAAKTLAEGMSREVFSGAKVEFYACNDRLKPVKLMASS